MLILIPVGKILGQEKDAKDFVIELPLDVDEFSKKLEINSNKLQQIKGNRNRCKYLIINDINASKQLQPKVKLFLEKYKPKELPFMEGIVDTIAILINDSRIAPDFKYLLFIGLDEQLEVRYLYTTVDSDEINPCHNNFVFAENEQFKSIQIESGHQHFDFLLLNPFYDEKVKKEFFQTKDPGKFQFIINTGIPNGESSLRYKPDTSTTFTSVYYDARIQNGFAIQMQCSYSYKRFLVGAFTRYETYNYENITRIILSKKSSGSLNLDYSGNGNWPARIIHVGVITAYDFLILEKFIFTPSFNAGYYWVIGNSSPFDPNFNTNTQASYKETYSLSTGAALKFPIYKQLWFSIGAIYQFNNFNAKSYFSDIKPDSYQMRQEIYRFDFGICYQF